MSRKAIFSAFFSLFLFLLPSYEAFSQPYAYITNGATNRINVINIRIDDFAPERDIVVEECTFDGIDTPVSVLLSEQPNHDLFMSGTSLSIDGFSAIDEGCDVNGFCTIAEPGTQARGLTDIVVDNSGTKLYVICSGIVYYGYAFGRGTSDGNPHRPTLRGEPELGTVFLVDIASGTVEATIEVGDDPQALALSPDGSTLYVANANIPIDFSGFNNAGAPTDTNIPTNAPNDDGIFDYVRIPTASPIGDVGVAQGRSGDSGNSITVINTADNTVRATVDLSGIEGSDPREMTITRDGNWLIIGNYDYNIFRDPRDIQSPNYQNSRNPADNNLNLVEFPFFRDFPSAADPYRGNFNNSSLTVLDLRGGALSDGPVTPFQTIMFEDSEIHDMIVDPGRDFFHIFTEYTVYSIDETPADGSSPRLIIDRGEELLDIEGNPHREPIDRYRRYSINPSPTTNDALILARAFDFLPPEFLPEVVGLENDLDATFQLAFNLAGRFNDFIISQGTSGNVLLYDTHNRGRAYLIHHQGGKTALRYPQEDFFILSSQGGHNRNPSFGSTPGLFAGDFRTFIDITGDTIERTDDNIRRAARDINIVAGVDEEGDCADGLDNDLDLEIDCDDNDCAGETGCESVEAEVCADGIDNDLDGREDCADGDCVAHSDCQNEICDDGIDNDADRDTDCDDRDCAGETVCRPQTSGGSLEICTDGIDNDFDSRIDCDDADCSTHRRCEGDPTEMICDDRLDNDRDTLIDCNDSDCANDPVCRTTPPDDLCAGRPDGTPADEGMICCNGRATAGTECPPMTPPSRVGDSGCTLVGSSTVAEATMNLLLPMMVFGLAFGLRRVRRRK